MKNLKKFEGFLEDITRNAHHETTEDYIEKLYNKIENINVDINGFDFFKNNNGDYEWSNGIYLIDTKPYYSFNGMIVYVIDLYWSDESKNVEKFEIELPKLTSDNSVDKIFKEYKQIIFKITNNLNRRNDIIKKLQEIKNVYNFPIRLNGGTFKSIEVEDNKLNGILFSKIKTDKLLKIYDKIEKDYPEVLSAHKYNL